jgi:hypothetical protein
LNTRIAKACFGLFAVLLILQSGCLVRSDSAVNKTSLISSLQASTLYVYPKGGTEINCVVMVPKGDAVQYKWSSDGGILTGEGPIVRWEAPNEYGDYHVMVTVNDSNGGSDQSTLTIGVVPRPARRCCGG